MTPKEVISRLIRKEFDKLPQYWHESQRKELIECAEHYKLDCVTGMKKDN